MAWRSAALAALTLAGGVASSSARAIEGPIRASGYLKELWQYSASAVDDRPYFLNTDRARLTLDAEKSILRAHVDYDQEVLAGSFFRTKDYGAFGLGEAPAWLPMEQNISTGATSIWRQRLYRGWAGIENDDGVLRFGRQRVAWGTGKLWNPTDVLNPFNPISVERDERAGVDALYGRLALGPLSQAEIVYAPQDSWPRSAVLSRLRLNAVGFDVSLMGGKIASSTASWMAGGDFAGTLAQGTLHGEWSYADPATRTPYWKVDAGYDYSFASDTKLPGLKDASVVLEYFHNGAGAPDPARYDLSSLLSGREIALARDYLGATFSKDLDPLLKLELVAIENAADSSQFFSPSLQWNALQNLYLTAALQRFGGTKTTEFGRAANVTYLQAQYFF